METNMETVVNSPTAIGFDKEIFKKSILDNLKFIFRKTMDTASQQEIFQAVAFSAKDLIIDRWLATQKSFKEQDPKFVYYLSMEFLMGRALGNNLINLCCYKEVAEVLEELGLDINVIEDQEPDAALGNGGLGRLAACFIESLSTLNYPVYGCGIRYKYGMFKQEIRDGYQVEVPDNWLENGNPFEIKPLNLAAMFVLNGMRSAGGTGLSMTAMMLFMRCHTIFRLSVMAIMSLTRFESGMPSRFRNLIWIPLIRGIIPMPWNRRIWQKISLKCFIQTIITTAVRSCV